MVHISDFSGGETLRQIEIATLFCLWFSSKDISFGVTYLFVSLWVAFVYLRLRQRQHPKMKMKMGFAIASSSIDSVSAAIKMKIFVSLSLSPFPCTLLNPPSSKKCNLNLQKSVRDSAHRKIACSLLKLEDDVNDEVCELVNGVELSLEESEDTTIHAYLFTAVKNNNGTGLLLLSDVFGFEDSFTRDFAYRVACNGYNILVPDLFRGNPWSKEQPKDLFEQWIAKQNPERISKDISRWTKWMVDEFMAAGISKKLGIIGFCFGGGRVVEVLAQDKDAYFGTGVSFYGTRLESLAASDVQVPVLFILGDNDPLCAVSDVQNIEKKIDKGSKVVIFQGRGHGFAHRPGSPEEDADAEQAFVIMREWLHDNLVI